MTTRLAHADWNMTRTGTHRLDNRGSPFGLEDGSRWLLEDSGGGSFGNYSRWLL
jgi:hypothetical protein